VYTKGDFSAETEGFLTAAQDQALSTRALRNVFSSDSTTQCAICKEKLARSWLVHSIRGGMIMWLHIYIHCGKYGMEQELY